MVSKRRRKTGKRRGAIVSIAALVLGFAALAFAASKYESGIPSSIENAGEQLTDYTRAANAAQYYINGGWVREKNLETLLMIGIDDMGGVSSSDSYNNSNQADFLALFIRDPETGESRVLHINRDTMAEIPVLGVTGQRAGSHRGQLALAYTYGRGEEDSCENMVSAVSDLLYGIEIDHYITLSMDAVPILNDWAGGVTLEVLDDLTSVDAALVLGETVSLHGDRALAYVRTRMGLSDSTNLTRMNRQRQYAAAWFDVAKPFLADEGKVLDLIMQMSEYHYSDCTAGELAELAEQYSAQAPVQTLEIAGENVQGELYMEYYADEDALLAQVLNLFFEEAN